MTLLLLLRSAGSRIALTDVAMTTSGTFAVSLVAIRPLSAALTTSGTLAAPLVAKRPIAPTFATSGALNAVLVAKRVLSELQLATSGSLAAPLVAVRPIAAAMATEGDLSAPVARNVALPAIALTTVGTLNLALAARRPIAADLHTTSSLEAPIAGASIPLTELAFGTTSTMDVAIAKSEIPFAGGGGSGGAALGGTPLTIEQLLEVMRGRITVVASERTETVEPDLQNESEALSEEVESAPLENGDVLSAVDQLSGGVTPITEAAAAPADLPSRAPVVPAIYRAAPDPGARADESTSRGVAPEPSGAPPPQPGAEIPIEEPRLPSPVPTPEARQPAPIEQARSAAVADGIPAAIEQLLTEVSANLTEPPVQENDDEELLALAAAVYAYASWSSW